MVSQAAVVAADKIMASAPSPTDMPSLAPPRVNTNSTLAQLLTGSAMDAVNYARETSAALIEPALVSTAFIYVFA